MKCGFECCAPVQAAGLVIAQLQEALHAAQELDDGCASPSSARSDQDRTQDTATCSDSGPRGADEEGVAVEQRVSCGGGGGVCVSGLRKQLADVLQQISGEYGVQLQAECRS